MYKVITHSDARAISLDMGGGMFVHVSEYEVNVTQTGRLVRQTNWDLTDIVGDAERIWAETFTSDDNSEYTVDDFIRGDH